ncbi:DNA-binding response OmpR family regulator [Alkalibacillus flavidus]|uniref:DNA-binding response OmpR family regulator n=1 Tax=Alkalibacillus flavidus TaxID=546021 RepID=A0ABV2KT08_9BACI
MKRVLIVDDEQRMLDLIEVYLQTYEYTCFKALNGSEALNYLDEESIDIILLDVMMPDISGFDLSQRIRTISDIPIIMLTARDEQEDILKGFDVGADDYITKPFNDLELVARMEALLKRTQPQNVLKMNGLVWNHETYELSYKGEIIKLTRKEFEMIGLLLKHPNQVFERERLIDLIWGFNSDVEGRTIDSHVRNIRDKIRQTDFPVDQHLKTVWGVGYKWER